jgi:predicted XRE-type DNA-binding protein
VPEDHESRPLFWIASSKRDLMALPLRVRRFFSHALDFAQRSCDMERRVIDGIEVERSSGNVFADLGLPDAEKLKIKSGLVIEITRAVRRLGLTQEEAGRRMGIPQPKVSGLMRGDFANLSERKLMDCLNRLGYDIEIRVRPTAEQVGQLRLAIA